jgi:hypothetical protein
LLASLPSSASISLRFLGPLSMADRSVTAASAMSASVTVLCARSHHVLRAWRIGVTSGQ